MCVCLLLREREREIRTDRQTDGRTDRQTERQTDVKRINTYIVDFQRIYFDRQTDNIERNFDA